MRYNRAGAGTGNPAVKSAPKPTCTVSGAASALLQTQQAYSVGQRVEERPGTVYQHRIPEYELCLPATAIQRQPLRRRRADAVCCRNKRQRAVIPVHPASGCQQRLRPPCLQSGEKRHSVHYGQENDPRHEHHHQCFDESRTPQKRDTQ